jgi:pantetheine-phosphate adenylyltransferase
VKSARTGADFETEQQMAQTNRAATGINTVVLFSTPEHQFISSTYIRQFAQQGGTMRTNLAPQCVLEALAKKKS